MGHLNAPTDDHADHPVIAKRDAQASVPSRMTKGAGRVWGWIVAPIVVWLVIFFAGSWVWHLFWNAAS